LYEKGDGTYEERATSKMHTGIRSGSRSQIDRLFVNGTGITYVTAAEYRRRTQPGFTRAGAGAEIEAAAAAAAALPTDARVRVRQTHDKSMFGRVGAVNMATDFVSRRLIDSYALYYAKWKARYTVRTQYRQLAAAASAVVVGGGDYSSEKGAQYTMRDNVQWRDAADTGADVDVDDDGVVIIANDDASPQCMATLDFFGVGPDAFSFSAVQRGRWCKCSCDVYLFLFVLLFR
jgi:hypothetical protein